MENITIGLWVSGGMLVLVFAGMRVAFAAGLAGFLGLVWLRWNGFDLTQIGSRRHCKSASKLLG